jgi:hypothetical protein
MTPSQGCQIFLDAIYHNGGKYRYQITISHKIYQCFPFQGAPKFTQIGILGLKIYRLATLLRGGTKQFIRKVHKLAPTLNLVFLRSIRNEGSQKSFRQTLPSRVARWYIFKLKIPVWVNFWWCLQWKMFVYFMDFWSILRSIGIFH